MSEPCIACQEKLAKGRHDPPHAKLRGFEAAMIFRNAYERATSHGLGVRDFGAVRAAAYRPGAALPDTVLGACALIQRNVALDLGGR